MKRRHAALTAIAAAISVAPVTAVAAPHVDGDVAVVARHELPGRGADFACLRAGVRTLISADLLVDVARNGLPIAKAVSLGVAPRPGTDLSSVPDPLPLPVVLVDHLRGDRSLFIYPWCA